MPDFSNNSITRTLRGWISHVSPSSSREASPGNRAGRSVQTTEGQRTEGLSRENDHPQRSSRSLRERFANSFLGKLFIRQPSNAHLEHRTTPTDSSNHYIDRPVHPNLYAEIDSTLEPNTDNLSSHPYAEIPDEVSQTHSSDEGYLEPTPDQHSYVNNPLREIEPSSLSTPNERTPEYTDSETLNQNIHGALGVKSTNRVYGAGNFGSVSIITPDTSDRTRPMRALKTTINEKRSREIEILNQLEKDPHKNIVSAKGTYRSESRVDTGRQVGFVEGIELEFVGQSLEDVLKPEKKLGAKVTDEMKGGLPPVMLKKVAIGLTRALEHLHTKTHPPILHMDLNPGNILLTGDGEVKLTDFGNSLQMFPDGFRGQSFQAHVFHTAPELAYADGLPTRQAEMWSLGSLLYEAATGEKLCLFNPMSPSVPVQERYDVMKSFVTLGLGNPLLQKPENTHLKDLLTNLLSMTPGQRPSASEVLEHPYFS
ncbi:protein kinase domain-containing protein [Endozoicomonas arenosclerae]|uniref:protein kinase domain-containing protein n=1 Tax=Endozoicomonas arenosclerae TaxID=1633495 RepID=UPI00078153C1|nr:protein kinase [Endozoicomonas arenosclerae]